LTLESRVPLAARIETARLVLRKPEVGDAQAIFDGWASCEAATRLMAWPRHLALSDTLAFLGFTRDEWERWAGGPYLIQHRATVELVGSCGFSFRSAGVAEVGYMLAPTHWHQGYATEALAGQLDAAGSIAPLRVTATVHPDNRASLRVLEKCGFAPDDPPETDVVFPNLASGHAAARRLSRVIGG
jgi:ribosomal-protein-alanine N-acetyltransferase